MSELAERIRAAVERRNRNEEAIASEGASGISHWPTTQERNELRIELAELLTVNAPTILAGLAALEADPAAEIAALKAENERLRESIAPVAAEINNRWADVHDESWSADYHCEFEMTVAECRALLKAIEKPRAALSATERSKP